MKRFIALLLAAVTCLSLVACDKTPDENKEETSTKAPVVQTSGDVKLTKDNFETYFEFVEEPIFTKNSSGEINKLHFRNYYKLKDDFVLDVDKSTIELTYNYSTCTRDIQIDFVKQDFNLGENIKDKTVIENINLNTISNITSNKYAVFLYQAKAVEKGDKEFTYFSDFKLVSVKGTLHLVEKAEEHNHSSESHTH